MTNTTLPSDPNWRMLCRADLLALLQTALSVNALRFARQAALGWLAYFPGDLPVNRLYARGLHLAGRAEQARPILEKLCQADPEDLEAWEGLYQALQELVVNGSLERAEVALQIADCRAAIFVLGGRAEQDVALPVWATGLRQSRLALEAGDLETAERLVHQALLVESLPALVAVTHLNVAASRDLPRRAMQDLAGYYHQRFPGSLAPALRLADSLIEGGESEKAVELLHRAATEDITGQVVTRLWGLRHPYLELWPAPLDAPLELAVPADVAVPLGLNRLSPPPLKADSGEQSAPAGQVSEAGQAAPAGLHTRPISPARPTTEIPEVQEPAVIYGDSPHRAAKSAGEQAAVPDGVPVHSPNEAPTQPFTLPSSASGPGGREHGAPAIPVAHSASRPPSTLPETLRSVQEELERVAASLKRDHLARADGRFPVYVVFTSYQGLQKKYSSEALAALDKEMKRLVAAFEGRRDWGGILVYADDPASTAAVGLQPAQPGDPWSFKLALADLDASLARRGEMIGALLIVGGPEVVPFHHLPNPVDDADSEVPSDNPYATRDENYFIPEWPVARLPGGAQASAHLMLQALRQMSARHSQNARPRPWFKRWWSRWSDRFRLRLHRKRPAWGYTAAVWRRASVSVFRPIGDPHAMLVSPPTQVNGQPGKTSRNKNLPSARLGYFNLHGLQDAGEWYGQRDPAEPAGAPDYPVALRPQDVLNGGRAPQVVFSEACYGAHLQDRSIEDAISLRFLASGTHAMAGSTCTAYGSITTPLLAADLLGHAFWKYLREGIPAGEALRRAKIHLAREMHRRQGYLDGEDQKTLISFVLYGDPLAMIAHSEPQAKAIFRPLKVPAVKTVCDRTGCHPEGQPAPAPTPVPAETLAQVKQVVAQYLPGMQDAEMCYTENRSGCRWQDHNCPSSCFSMKSRPAQAPGRSVVVLTKQVAEPLASVAAGTGAGASQGEPSHNGAAGREPVRLHRHYARLTLDEQGNLVKLAVSR